MDSDGRWKTTGKNRTTQIEHHKQNPLSQCVDDFQSVCNSNPIQLGNYKEGTSPSERTGPQITLRAYRFTDKYGSRRTPYRHRSAEAI